MAFASLIEYLAKGFSVYKKLVRWTELRRLGPIMLTLMENVGMQSEIWL